MPFVHTQSVSFSSPASTISSLPSATPSETPMRDNSFYLDTAIFLAENRLFKVPCYDLPGDAAIFNSILASATDGAGLSDENPIHLDAEVTAADFRSLLKATITPLGATALVLSLEEWMGVLTLAKKWNLAATGDKAVASAETEIQKMTSVEMVIFGKRYGVAKWLNDGYCALVSDEEPITDEERETLGWETYARLMRVREKGRLSALEKLFSVQEAKFRPESVHCSITGCQQFHEPYCAQNVHGIAARQMRLCNACDRHYHIPGCGAGTSPVRTVKECMQDQWDMFDWTKAVEEEFGAPVRG